MTTPEELETLVECLTDQAVWMRAEACKARLAALTRNERETVKGFDSIVRGYDGLIEKLMVVSARGKLGR